MEMARAMVACSKWVWLRGMSVRHGDHPSERWIFDGETWISDEGDVYAMPDQCAPASLILGIDAGPDLDDDVTRLAVLAVVRMADGCPTGFVEFIDRSPAQSFWQYRGRTVFHTLTEEGALLAALNGIK